MSNVLSKMPNISIPRTRFKQEFNHSTSFEHGKLIPIDCFEIIPGDNVSLTLSSLIRMSTPIAPIMGNIKAYVHAFFVPMRLVWTDAEKFYGDPSNHGKVASITPVDPSTILVPNWSFTYSGSSSGAESDFCKSIAAYNGKPFVKSGTTGSNLFISNLKEKAYVTIWNEYFRPSNLILPAVVNMASATDQASIGSRYDGLTMNYYTPVFPVCKQYDYFTACTLSPQFGSSVVLPLGDIAPVRTDSNSWIAQANQPALKWGIAATGNVVSQSYNLAVNSNGNTVNSDVSGSSYNTLFPGNLVADLSAATSATINSIRYAFQVQKYLERSNYGSRFFEILNAHYGVTSPDGRLQRPDRLGYHSFFINVSQVIASATSTDGSGNSQLGQTGAVSVTGDKVHLFSGAFTEPGYLYVMLCTKYDRSYSGGLLREDMRKTRLEFYSPEFANLGDQEIKKNEIALYSQFSTNTLVDPDATFGYQEHWAEYRYRKDRVSGILNPTSTAQVGVSSLDFWTLSDVYDSLDSTQVNIALNDSFLFEDRTSLARALVTGTNGPDYIGDFHFEYIVTRELPLYSIPGLIDHFGAL